MVKEEDSTAAVAAVADNDASVVCPAPGVPSLRASW